MKVLPRRAAARKRYDANVSRLGFSPYVLIDGDRIGPCKALDKELHVGGGRNSVAGCGKRESIPCSPIITWTTKRVQVPCDDNVFELRFQRTHEASIPYGDAGGSGRVSPRLKTGVWEYDALHAGSSAPYVGLDSLIARTPADYFALVHTTIHSIRYCR